MGSNYYIANENIVEIAKELLNQDYEELLPTNEYAKCTHLFICESKKHFWFSNAEVINHTVQIIKFGNEALKTNLKEIQKWETQV